MNGLTDTLESSNAPTLYLVYGNHGDNPSQLNDYFEMFLQVARASGVVLKLEKNIVPNAHNILIELFSKEDVDEIKKIIAENPSTRLACLCTEFVNKDTFNFFNFNSTSTKKIVSTAVGFFPSTFFVLFKSILPSIYDKLKSFYNLTVNKKDVYNIHMSRTFQERFDNFKSLVSKFDYIWCVADFQIPAYEEAFPSAKVMYFPIVTFRTKPEIDHHDSFKDIDIFFSGSLTPERQKHLELLEMKGLKVISGMWSEVLRDHYLKRSKICLQLKQNPEWPYPSVMRLHQLLSSGNIVLAEECSVPCVQDKHVLTFKNDEFINCVFKLLQEEKNFSERGRIEFERYNTSLVPDKKTAVDNVWSFLNCTPNKNLGVINGA